MDARNVSGRDLSIPSIGLVVPAGATIREAAGQYAEWLPVEPIQGILPQAGTWEPADSEAEKWMKAWKPEVDPDVALRVALREQAERNAAMPETVGLMPTPAELKEREKAQAAERKAAEAGEKKAAAAEKTDTPAATAAPEPEK